MSLLCGSNAALESVKDSVKALRNQLSDGKTALASIGSIADGIKSKVSGLKAQVKSLDSFQSELANLPQNLSSAALVTFKSKWGARVPNIDSYLSKIKSGISIDFCKEVPNVNIDPDTGATVNQAKTSPTPNDNPTEVKSLDKTVVDRYTAASSGKSEQIPAEVREAYLNSAQKAFRESVLDRVIDRNKAALKAKADSSDSSDYAAVKAKLRKTGKSSEQLIAEGLLNQQEAAAAKKYDKAIRDLQSYNVSSGAINSWWLTVQDFHSGLIAEKDFRAVEKSIKNNPQYADYIEYFDKTTDLGTEWSAVIKKYSALVNNRRPKQ